MYLLSLQEVLTDEHSAILTKYTNLPEFQTLSKSKYSPLGMHHARM